MRIKTLAIALALAVATPALAGPPWISIELPPNPYDRASRGAFLAVHAFHHGTEVGIPVTGVAEGIVSGQRRSIKLQLVPTSRTGVYALRNQWGTEGVWTLVLSVSQGDGEGNTAQALVEVDPGGVVKSVRVPAAQRGEWLMPQVLATRDIESALRARVRAAN
jgi:hypothetical protein